MAADGRIYVTILCGAGARPIARRGERTPLEVAETPNLDALAKRGAVSLVRVIDDVVTPESDSGAMALLGYDPLTYYTGRGALEALGMGFWDAARSCVGFRVNFASQDPATGRLDRRTARDLSDPELQALAEEVRQQVALPEVDYRLIAFGRHRGILCLRSETVALSGEVTNTDPGFRRLGSFGVPSELPYTGPSRCVPLDASAAAAATAKLVEHFAGASAAVLQASEVNRRRQAAGKLAANVILFRDAGHELPELESFGDRTGLTVSLHGQVPAEHGLCTLIGGRFVESKPAPGQSDGDYYRALARSLPDDPADVVLVHLKGADEPGHDDQPAEKARALESIDRHYVAELAAHVGPRDVIVFTGDHATPCECGIHSTDPVPTVAAGPGVPRDGASRFSEREAASGGLPVERAVDLLQFLVDARSVA